MNIDILSYSVPQLDYGVCKTEKLSWKHNTVQRTNYTKYSR